MAPQTLRPLGFGEILDGAFTLYRRNLATLLLTALVPTAVLTVVFMVLWRPYFDAAATGDMSAMTLGTVGLFILGLLIAGLAYTVMWGALTRQLSQAYLGQPTSLGDGMRTGMRKLLPVMGSAILIFLGLLAAYIAVLIVFVLIGLLGGATGSPTVAVVVGVVGGVLAVAGYLVVIGTLFAVFPAIVVEDKGPMEAIGRSFDLSRGALGRVVGLMLVTLLITYLPILGVMLVTGTFSGITDPTSVSAGQSQAQNMLGLAAGVLTTPFMMAVIVLLYFDRRVRTEALDVQMAADRLAVAGS